MTMTDLAGYTASTILLLTFMTEDMCLLCVLTIFSNIAFITYGVFVWLPPVFCLHFLLLPVNAFQLREMRIMDSCGCSPHSRAATKLFRASVPCPENGRYLRMHEVRLNC